MREARGYARSTTVNLLGVISCSMRYAKRQGWIQINPAEDIDLPSQRAVPGRPELPSCRYP